MRYYVIPAGLCALILCGCQQKAATPAPAPAPPAVTVSDFNKPITALGAEPFWSVTIKGTQLQLARPDETDVVATAPGATIEPGQAAWIGKTAEGQTLEVKVFVSPCSDGMSDRAYPMTSEVTLGRNSWHGCAVKSADLKTAPPT